MKKTEFRRNLWSHEDIKEFVTHTSALHSDLDELNIEEYSDKLVNSFANIMVKHALYFESEVNPPKDEPG